MPFPGRREYPFSCAAARCGSCGGVLVTGVRPVPARGRYDLEGFPCCCAPMLPPRPRTWRAGCWRARRAGPGGCARGDTPASGRSAC
jgi:hypothetical protein